MPRETSKTLRAENQELRLRLEEAQQALEAIRAGQVESLVVEGPDGPRIFSLEGASHSYRALVEAMSEGAATLSEDGAILYCNVRFARMLGASLERVMGGSLRDFAPESLRASLDALLWQAREGEARGELRLRAEDGQEVPVQLSVSPLHEEGRRVLCLVATDLREQKQNEQVLAEGLLARSVLEQAADAIVVCDDKGQITRVSRTAEQLCGCCPLRAYFEAAFPVVLTSPLLGGGVTANALNGAVFRSEPATLARFDGSKAELLVSATPLQTADGRIVGCVVTMVDVSEHQRADEALRESAARFRSVLEDSRDVIYRVNVQSGRYEYVSPSAEAVVGFSPDELLAMDAEASLAMVHPDDAPAMQAAVARLADTGKADVEYRQKTKSGDYRWLSNHMSLVKDSTGRPLYRNGNIRDITKSKQAEEAIRAGSTLLNSVLDSSLSGIMAFKSIRDAQGRITDFEWQLCNATAERIVGRRATDLVGRRLLVEMPGNKADGLFDKYVVVVESGRPLHHEHYYEHEGLKTWFDTCAAQLGDGFAVTFSDITVRKRAEEELRGAQQRLESLLENSPLAVIEWSSADYRIVRWSDEATKVFGWTAEETVGRRIDELNWVYPEDWPLVEQVMAEMLSGRRPRNVNKNRNVRKDGSVIHCEWYNSTLHHPDGKFSVLSLVLDVTERKRAEQAFERTNLKLAEVLDSIQDDFYVLDRAWKFTFSSKQFTARIGKRPEDFLGHNIWEMFPKHLGTVYEENLRAAMDKRETRRFEIGGKYTDAWYRMTASPSAEGITVLGTEITENKKIEEALREADQRKNEFLAMLSHELRNPLAPIRNSTYVLEHCEPGGEQARRALAVIDRQAGQLAHLVDDLLDVTRITRNKIELQRQTLELNELVHHTVEDHRTLFDRSDVRIEFHPASQPMFVSADRNRLVQVIGNLLQNAAKFTGRGGETRITISADATERQAVIQVADTGVGMTPELVARLFQPFSQADATLDRSKGGLGLGLALAKGLVELHGGDITARSAGLGQGAEFVVRLPLAMDDAVAPRPTTSPSKGRRRVLIIEDNVDAADSLRDVLAFGEHDVEVAYNGPQGIAKAQEFRPEVVLCDIGLPSMDGYEVARAFRADDALKGVFLVALSGYALPEDLQRAQEAGFDRHLAKPPSIEGIEEALASGRSP